MASAQSVAAAGDYNQSTIPRCNIGMTTEIKSSVICVSSNVWLWQLAAEVAVFLQPSKLKVKYYYSNTTSRCILPLLISILPTQAASYRRYILHTDLNSEEDSQLLCLPQALVKHPMHSDFSPSSDQLSTLCVQQLPITAYKISETVMSIHPKCWHMINEEMGKHKSHNSSAISSHQYNTAVACRKI